MSRDGMNSFAGWRGPHPQEQGRRVPARVTPFPSEERAAREGGRGVRRRRRRGFSYVELLAAALLLSIAALAAARTWAISSRAPANKRVTEMGVYVATQELEKLKVTTYSLLVTGNSGTHWYDKNGAYLGSSATTGVYQANWSVNAKVNRDGVSNVEDLLELQVVVKDTTGSQTYETAQTLLTFGGV